MSTRLQEPERSQVIAEIKAEYEEGSSIRTLAKRIGFSYTATRAMLLSAGTQLRPRRLFDGTEAAGVDVNPHAVPCGFCGVLAGARCLNTYGMRTARPHAVRRRQAIAEAVAAA
jgi:hypothetical protein